MNVPEILRGISRRTAIITATIAALAALAIVVALGFAAAQPVGEQPGSGTLSPGASSSPQPGADSESATPEPVDPGAQPGFDPSFDPSFGDTVVDTVSGSDPARFADGLEARVVTIEQTTATATGIGESSGPAVLVTIELRNAGSAAASLDSVTVNLFAGASSAPGIPMAAEPFSGSLAPGAAAIASYTFGTESSAGGYVVTVGTAADSGLVVVSQG